MCIRDRGGAFLFPGRELLVIDSGTAITYDFVSADGEFRGGNISPGLGIRCLLYTFRCV